MATLNELISELKTFEDITNHRKFMRKVNEFIKKHGYTHLGNGAYTEAYSNGSNNILKYCPNPGQKFHAEYGPGYLQPSYISKNLWLVIQPKALSYYEVDTKYHRTCTELRTVEIELKELQAKKDKLIGAKTEIALTRKKFNPVKVKNHKNICDVRVGNMGIYRDEVVMLDLNNHVTSPYRGD